MKPIVSLNSSLLRMCVAAAAVVAVSAPAHAAVILTGNSSIPVTDVAVNTSSATVTTNENSLRPGRSFEQTFTVGTAFQLDAIFIEYQAANSLDGTFNLKIFTVANVNSGANPAVPVTTLLDLPITLNTAVRAAANFTNSTTVSSILKFDLTDADQINLAAGGYALELSSTGTDPGSGGLFNIQFNLNTGTYAGGRYEGGSANDAPIFLTAVPEPSSFLLVLLGATGLVSRRRR